MQQIKIIFIPPSGQFKMHDYSLQRIVKWLKLSGKVQSTLLHIKAQHFELDTSMFNNVIEAKNRDEIILLLKTMPYDIIFHRSWMTAYEFAAQLVKEFDNVAVNIKDWNFAPKDVYEFLYPDFKDYEAIEYIFKNSNHILSHFTKEQAKLWAKDYKTDKNKFISFPEYCNKNSFNDKPALKYKNINIVYAGAIPATIQPEDFFPGKSHIRSIKQLTKQNINVDFVLPEHVHKNTLRLVDMFKDFIYEDETNDRFNIIKGEALNSKILNKYHFGFFELEASGINQSLYEYAITSKFAFYLEAGLPILINDRFISMSKLVKKHQLGIVFNNDDVKNMSSVLNISQKKYDSFVKNIKKYRKNFIYDNKKLKKLGLKNEYTINCTKI